MHLLSAHSLLKFLDAIYKFTEMGRKILDIDKLINVGKDMKPDFKFLIWLLKGLNAKQQIQIIKLFSYFFIILQKLF